MGFSSEIDNITQTLTTTNQNISLFGLYFQTNDQLSVVSKDVNGDVTPRTLTTDYTLVGAGLETYGTLTVVGGTVGDIWYIVYDIPITQLIPWVQQGGFSMRNLTTATDKAAMISKMHQETLDRTPRFAVSDAPSVAMVTKPNLDDQANVVEVWNGTAFVLVSTIGTDPINISALSPPNHAALKAIDHTTLTNGDLAQTNGYTSQDDGGQVTYQWNSTSTATAEDGKYTAATSNGASAGRWVADFSGIVNAKAFPSVQIALDSGLDIFIPEETTMFSSPFLCTTSFQVVYGVGHKSILKTTDDTLQFGFAVTTGTIGFEVKDLKLEGAALYTETAPLSNGAIGVNTNAAGTAFEMTYPDLQNGQFRATNVWFDNWGTGIANNHSDEAQAHLCRFTRMRGDASSYGYGITSSGSRCNYSNNIFDNNSISWKGSHSGSANASVLTDSTKDWPVNAHVGLTIFNKTDGSSGTITANTATTITATLSGGTDDDWDVLDEAWIIEGGEGRHSVYLNGHSRECTVVGNKAYGYSRNPYQFKCQSLATSAFSHYIAGNLAKDSNMRENVRGATYLFDCQTPLTAVGGDITFVDNVADGCLGEQLRMEYHAGSTIRNFKCVNVNDHYNAAFVNYPILIIYSDRTKLSDISIDNVDGSSLIGIELQNCAGVEVDKVWINGTSFRAGVRFNAATPDTTNTCKVTNLTVVGTTSMGDVEDAAFDSQGIVTNKHIDAFTGREPVLKVFTIATGAIAIGVQDTIRVDTEAAASSDDVVTMTGGRSGQIVAIKAANDARTVVVKDSGAGADTFRLSADMSLDSSQDRIVVEYDGNAWNEISRSNNG